MLQPRARRTLALVGWLCLASTIGCGRNKPANQVTRYGDDVLASGSAPTVMDSVPGDVILAGRDVLFSGAVAGDYLGAGGSQTIDGQIHGSVRATGGEIHLAATVDRNVTIGGGHVELDSAAAIGGNAYLIAGSIRVDGAVRGGLVASGGSITINGVIGRNVDIFAGELRVGPHAQIAGNLRYRVPAGKVHIDPAARISGKVTALPVPGRHWGFWSLWTLGILLVGVIFVALFPRFTTGAVGILSQRAVRSGLVGLGWMILSPPAIVLVAVTVVGIPLALVWIAVYSLLFAFASVPFAVWLGGRILGARVLSGQQGALLNFLIGAVLLVVVRFIPFVGGVLTLIAFCLGVGSILLQILESRARQLA